MNNRLPKWCAIRTATGMDGKKKIVRVMLYKDLEKATLDLNAWMNVPSENKDVNLSYEIRSNDDLEKALDDIPATSCTIDDVIEIALDGIDPSNSGYFDGEWNLRGHAGLVAVKTPYDSIYGNFENKPSEKSVEAYKGHNDCLAIAIDFIKRKVYCNLDKKAA